MTDLLDDALLARSLAESAGRILLDVRASSLTGRDLAKAGDRTAHEHLVARLAQSRPGDLVLSEEGADPSARVLADRVWIVDPLDGTREFGEPGRTDWAVHVALVNGGGKPIAGAVALPAIGITLSTDPAPAFPPPREGPLRVIVSRSRPPAAAIRVADALGAELVSMGSAGAKAMAVVLGEADVYAHAGGQYEWDNCAPAAVALAAGFHASRVDGRPLVYNQSDPWLPDLLICRPELRDIAVAAVGR
jgi:3'(2'), 5'-bisphosphate nucleotidase